MSMLIKTGTGISVNLNQVVKVRLSHDGFKYWKGVNDATLIKHSPALIMPIEKYKEKQNDEGYVSFHLWEFMQIFGPSIVFGTTPLFDTTIILMD